MAYEGITLPFVSTYSITCPLGHLDVPSAHRTFHSIKLETIVDMGQSTVCLSSFFSRLMLQVPWWVQSSKRGTSGAKRTERDKEDRDFESEKVTASDPL